MIDALTSIFTGDIKARYDDRGRWAQVEEGRVLYDLVKDNNVKLALEIGTANGWTACWMAAAGAKVYTFDYANRAKIYTDPKFPLPELKDRIVFHHTPSPDCFGIIKKLTFTAEPMVFFVDGDHGFEGVSRDFDDVMAIARPGDKLVLHDTAPHAGYPGVRRCFRRKVIHVMSPERYQIIETLNGMAVVTV